MGDADAEAFDDIEFLVVHVDHVGRDRPVVEKADLIEINDGPVAVLFGDVVDLFLRFGNVGHDRCVIFVGQCLDRFEVVCGDRVRCMRCGRRDDERVIRPFFKILFGIGHRLGICLVVRDRKIDDRLAEHTAHPGFLGLGSDRILEVIHIAIRRSSAADHLGHAETRAGTDELLGHVLSLGREDEFRKPVVKVEIVRDAAKQGHRGVCVSVDESGDDGLAGGVDGAGGTILPGNLRRGANRDDLVSLNSDCSVLDDAVRTVHCDNGAAGDKQIGIGRSRTCRTLLSKTCK